jgi:thiol-disulfide isomerase/thioredoxin
MISKIKSIVFVALIAVLSFSCSNEKSIPSCLWHAEIKTVIGTLPFELEIGDSLNVVVINGEERLQLDTAFLRNDSLVISMEIFDGEIVTAFTETEMSGRFAKKLGNLSEVSSTFKARKGKYPRFEGSSATSAIDVTGKWEVVFYEDSVSSYPAIGVFEQVGSVVKGTFLTETGDYRYLSGNIVGDSLKLSCFDGTHVFLFTALVNGDEMVDGKFSYSLNYFDKWTGKRNENAELSDPETLTFIKEGYDGVSFSFKNTDGEVVSFPSPAYEGKVVLFQIMGSWCPNCMDETKFLTKWYEKQDTSKVKIIGLSFEKSMDPDFAYPKINKMVKRFGINYEVLLAGLPDKAEAAKSLPMLNEIISFPTTIYIDKKGEVRKIHTGFSGPGTGVYYTNFIEDFDRYMEKLLTE